MNVADAENVTLGVVLGVILLAVWLCSLGIASTNGYRKGLQQGRTDNPPMDNLCGCGHARSFHTNLSGGCYEVTVRAKYEENNHTCACRQYAQAPLDTSGMFPG